MFTVTYIDLFECLIEIIVTDKDGNKGLSKMSYHKKNSKRLKMANVHSKLKLLKPKAKSAFTVKN